MSTEAPRLTYDEAIDLLIDATSRNEVENILRDAGFISAEAQNPDH